MLGVNLWGKGVRVGREEIRNCVCVCVFVDSSQEDLLLQGFVLFLVLEHHSFVQQMTLNTSEYNGEV